MTFEDYVDKRNPSLREEFDRMNDPNFMEMEAVYERIDYPSQRMKIVWYNIMGDDRKSYRMRDINREVDYSYTSDELHLKLKKISPGSGVKPKDSRRNKWVDIRGERVFIHMATSRDWQTGKMTFSMGYTDSLKQYHHVYSAAGKPTELVYKIDSDNRNRTVDISFKNTMKDIKEKFFGDRDFNLAFVKLDDLVYSLHEESQK